MNEASVCGYLVDPSARPRSFGGKASVRIALEFAADVSAANTLEDPHGDQPPGRGDAVHPGH